MKDMKNKTEKTVSNELTLQYAILKIRSIRDQTKITKTITKKTGLKLLKLY